MEDKSIIHTNIRLTVKSSQGQHIFISDTLGRLHRYDYTCIVLLKGTVPPHNQKYIFFLIHLVLFIGPDCFGEGEQPYIIAI